MSLRSGKKEVSLLESPVAENCELSEQGEGSVGPEKRARKHLPSARKAERTP
jgi:hypothetical protein